MSTSSPSPQQDEPLESDAVSGGSPSLNEETVPPALPDPDEISAGEDEEDDDEGEEFDEETPAASSTMDLRIQPPITDPHASASDVILSSPTGRRGGAKRKKGKGKGKGKSSTRKQQAIELKLQSLRRNLNPIPFIARKILDFAKHEKLLKKLGLWEFVHIDFDRTIRVEFIAQLVANYNAKSRASNVNGYRVMVNRADLARAFKLSLKKEKSNAGVAEVDLDSEALSDDSIGFVLEFLSGWVLLHEDMWLMPTEVADWMKLIKEGHPEKVDWAGLLWFMVEKELKQGGQLTDCYYASHLQHLIKFQRQNLFLVEESPKNEMEVVVETDKEVEDGDGEENMKDNDAVEDTEEERGGDSVAQGPSTELTLGQDGEKEDEDGEVVKEDDDGEVVKDDDEDEGVKDLEVMDDEKCKDSSDEDVGVEEQEDQDQDQEPWLLNGEDNPGEHFLQSCNAGNARKDEGEEEMDEDEDVEEDDDEARNNFHVFPNDDSLDGDGLTGNFLQGLEENQIDFTSQEQLRNASSVDARVDVLHMSSTPSFFNNSGKRVIEHDYDHPVNDNNSKRLRINETWDNKPLDIAMCIEQIQQMAERARMLNQEKEQAAEQLNMNQQILLNEVHKRDTVIDHLHKARLEESQKKDFTINRLERELYLMGSVLDGYRKALKETRKAFAEYRERAQIPEDPTYKDAGQGGLMLTAAEIEKLRKKKEEEFKMNCSYVEQKMKEVEVEYLDRLHEHADRFNRLDNKLSTLKAEFIALHSKRKTPPTTVQEVVHEVAEIPPVPEPMEEEAVAGEVSEPEPVPVKEPEEQVPEAAADDQPVPVKEPEEQVPEAAADDQPCPQPDEKVAEPTS